MWVGSSGRNCPSSAAEKQPPETFTRRRRAQTSEDADLLDLNMVRHQVGRERRLYKRYLGEARAQRAKAFKAWCAFNRDENQNSRNELKLQSIGE